MAWNRHNCWVNHDEPILFGIIRHDIYIYIHIDVYIYIYILHYIYKYDLTLPWSTTISPRIPVVFGVFPSRLRHRRMPRLTERGREQAKRLSWQPVEPEVEGMGFHHKIWWFFEGKLHGHLLLVGGLEHEFIWFFDFPYNGNNTPNWLSYFSEGLKPPTTYFGSY